MTIDETARSAGRKRVTPFRLRAFVCLLLLVSPCSIACRPKSGEAGGGGSDLLITGGTIIDGTGRAPRPKTALLIRDGSIARLGDEAELRQASPGAKVLDAAGRHILPGFIDSHVHYGDWGAQLYLNYGVTTVFDLGNQTEWIVAQREGIRRGRIRGPRVFATGNHLNGPATAKGEGRASDSGGWAHFVEDGPAAKAVCDLLVKQGVDAFKIQERLSVDSLRAIVEVAKARNMPIVGHTVNARDATLLGVRFVEHMRPIIRSTVPAGVEAADDAMDPAEFPKLIELLVAQDVYVNPTVFLGYVDVSRHRETYRAEDAALFPGLTFIPAYLKQRWLDYYNPGEKAERTKLGYQKVAQFLTEFVNKGGRLLSGTDSGRRLIPGLSLHREMEMLVEAGISPMEVIRATTQYPALFFGKEQEVGTIEAGRRADLLIVSGDPLRDISNTRKIAYVLKDGTVIDRSSPAYVNPIPRPVTEEVPPVLDSLQPVQLLQGDQAAKLVLVGREFVPDSIVRIGDMTVRPQFVSDGTLHVSVPPQLTGSVGTYAVSVLNPPPGGGTSNSRYVFVNFKYDQ